MHLHLFIPSSLLPPLPSVCFDSVPVEQQPKEAEEPQHLQLVPLLLPQLQCWAATRQHQHQLPASTCWGEWIPSQGEPPPVPLHQTPWCLKTEGNITVYTCLEVFFVLSVVKSLCVNIFSFLFIFMDPFCICSSWPSPCFCFFCMCVCVRVYLSCVVVWPGRGHPCP